ncbi:MAG: DEAD/DEAH box helicase [Spirochaetes bacterium]|nr:DEAD/DEAH box helicase [Spirochaetota bacterium]
MLNLDLIKNTLAKSEQVYKRGENIFYLGNYSLLDKSETQNSFSYSVDGSYGDYHIEIKLENNKIISSCTCPYPYKGCKHTVASCLDIIHNQQNHNKSPETIDNDLDFLSVEEIKTQALSGRKKKSKSESFDVSFGDIIRGEHLVKNINGQKYIVNIHDLEKESGHCTCPDFATNHLGTCKHLLHLNMLIKKDKSLLEQAHKETFPFIHVWWNSGLHKPVYFYDTKLPGDYRDSFSELFNENGVYKNSDITKLFKLTQIFKNDRLVRFDNHLMDIINDYLLEEELLKIKKTYKPDFSFIKTKLFPYQEKGVLFALFKKAAIIADEMGLGKTLQAISLAILKKQVFNFQKVLIISPSSLKEQWRLEIEKFTDEDVVVINGNKQERQQIYMKSKKFFKITNYEAVLRDILVIKRFEPDLIILDEAQRIKNFATKTHQAIKSIPHKHSLIITGTPLENKLEDLYSIVQFSDPTMLTPLWAFAAKHFNLSRSKKNKILGYKNLKPLFQKLQDMIIRRCKEDVFDDLPNQLVNTYYLDLSTEQDEIHSGYLRALIPLAKKRFLTPMDIQKMLRILLSMRMVCNSTYLIDKQTNISPKLTELTSIMKELVLDNNRKVVIFSEWTRMTYLIGKMLSNSGISFIEFTGKIPVKKRQVLIDEFNNNDKCKVFLSTDAGGVGLNLQSADCVINFELPWNPAKLNQRIGRINRIGQKSKTINVVNLVSKHSIEEKVLAGINRKQELFDAVLDGTSDSVSFTEENKKSFVNKIREMFNEELETPVKETETVSLEEDTPHYLNPEILTKNTENILDLEEEEIKDDPIENTTTQSDSQIISESEHKTSSEQLEQVMEQGVKFLSGLSAMVTGKPLITNPEEKTIDIDHKTGEVTFKFKLPGF